VRTGYICYHGSICITKSSFATLLIFEIIPEYYGLVYIQGKFDVTKGNRHQEGTLIEILFTIPVVLCKLPTSI
jgi:hypothetical protein